MLSFISQKKAPSSSFLSTESGTVMYRHLLSQSKVKKKLDFYMRFRKQLILELLDKLLSNIRNALSQNSLAIPPSNRTLGESFFCSKRKVLHIVLLSVRHSRSWK
jgi:hypothetical protein